MLILLFSVQLQLLPTGAQIDFGDEVTPITGLVLIDTLLNGEPAAFASAVRHLILPSITLARRLPPPSSAYCAPALSRRRTLTSSKRCVRGGSATPPSSGTCFVMPCRRRSP